MRPEALEQYNKALKAGQRYYKDAIGTGSYPYLPVLDEIVDESRVAARMELGIINKSFDDFERQLVADIIAAKISGKLTAADIFES